VRRAISFIRKNQESVGASRTQWPCEGHTGSHSDVRDHAPGQKCSELGGRWPRNPPANHRRVLDSEDAISLESEIQHRDEHLHRRRPRTYADSGRSRRSTVDHRLATRAAHQRLVAASLLGRASLSSECRETVSSPPGVIARASRRRSPAGNTGATESFPRVHTGRHNISRDDAQVGYQWSLGGRTHRPRRGIIRRVRPHSYDGAFLSDFPAKKRLRDRRDTRPSLTRLLLHRRRVRVGVCSGGA
jgi:hypothetical protein